VRKKQRHRQMESKKGSDTGRRCKKEEVPHGEGVEMLCCHKEQKRGSAIDEGREGKCHKEE
jgi:hypothetical protein